MPKRPRQVLLVLATTIALFLAGCLQETPSPEEATELGETNEYEVSAQAPEQVNASEGFVVQVTVEGSPSFLRNEVNARYGSTSTDAPSLAAYPQACGNVVTPTPPGTYELPCILDEPGTYHLRGHLRLTGEGQPTTDHWSEEVQVRVV